MDRQKGVEEVSEADAVGLGDEAEEGAVGVEGPGVGLRVGFEGVFVGSVEDLGVLPARGDPVGDLDGMPSPAISWRLP